MSSIRSDMLVHDRTFQYTGKPQRFKVPASVTQVTVDVVGADGASTPETYGPPGGLGGRVYAVLPVQPNETLYVYVGGKGAGSAGGFNGGGSGAYLSYGGSFGGGGASDIREGGQRLTDRIVVAGAGGGAGGNAYSGGAGAGGDGGTHVGASGAGGDYNGAAQGGRGGRQTHGGKGGQRGEGDYGYGQRGKPGTLGSGGAGGGLGCASSCEPGGGGGGGGSSYVEPGAKGVRMYRGWKDATGNGSVTIEWS